MTNNQLTTVIKQSGLDETKTDLLLKQFGQFYQEAKQIAGQASDIRVKDELDIKSVALARETRLKLKKIRVDSDKVRRKLKEDSLRESRAIDGIANLIKALIVPVEQYLEDQEKFAERMEAERKSKIESERINQLSRYVDEADGYSLHPDLMSQETFDKLLENSRLAFEAREKAEKEAEKERLAKIEAEKKEQERIRLENARLRAEAEKREKELAKERAKHEAKLKAERKARLIAEEKIKKENEALELKRRIEEEKKKQLLLAPDKEKLYLLAKTIRNIELPAVKSNEAGEVIKELKKRIIEISDWLYNEAEKI